MWKCSYCGKTTREGPGWRRRRAAPWEKCPGCGFTLGRRKATLVKHQILRDVCNTNNYDILIDACAGSGKVQLYDGEIVPGSPLIFEEIARKKTPPAGRVFIEAEPKTFKLLKMFCEGSDAQFICGDCNENIPKFTDGKVRTLVFIDPFGWGVPAINRDMIVNTSQVPNTDVLINFTYRIAREMGYVRKNLNSHIERNRKTAITWKKALHTFWGNLDWLKEWPSMKAREYAERYALPFREHNKFRIYRIPRFGRLIYHLIFATKFETPKYGLEKWITLRTQRRSVRGGAGHPPKSS